MSPAAVVFLGLDFVWLGLVAKTAYRSCIGGLMRAEINLTAAVVFYLVYVIGLVIFAIAPALKTLARCSVFSPMAPMSSPTTRR